MAIDDDELAEMMKLERLLNEVLEAGDLIVRRFAGRRGKAVRGSDVKALDDFMFTIVRIRRENPS
jgi:hypothetical protein